MAHDDPAPARLRIVRPGTPVDAGAVTLVFSDIEGSTRLLQRWGPEYAAGLGHHRRLLRRAVAEHGGQEVDTHGDAFLAAFASPVDAVSAAVEAQAALGRHAWPRGDALRVRMGVHTGRPVRTEEGWVGIDVHRGARICAAAHGGQVVVSAATRDHLSGVDVRDLGPHLLRGIADPQQLFQVLDPRLPADFPPLRAVPGSASHLPEPLTALVGRESELAGTADLMRDHRLVTLIGPGGVGKTRLSIEVARAALHDFPGGVVVVDLAPVTDPGLVLAAVASAVGVPAGADISIEESLHRRLGGEQTLLVLDNVEHVIGAAASIGALLSRCPRLTVLATSREPLRVSGEAQLRLGPLPPAAAVTLFAQRAREAWAHFELDEATRAVVSQVCGRLDGLPLAIELAAARVGVLPPTTLLRRLDPRLPVLTGGRRDQPERHQTIRSTIAWSHDLLPEGERQLLTRLGVFTGGWTLEAAEEVCGRGLAGGAVVEGLASLVDKSLVTRVPDPDTDVRFGMLETIREYAAELLAEDPEESVLRDAHARFHAGLAADAATTMHLAEGRRWVRRLDQEHGNLRAALDRLLTRGMVEEAVGLVGGAWRAWCKAGRLHEGADLVRRALAACEEGRPPGHAYAAVGLSEMLRLSGQVVASRQLKESLLPALLRDRPPLAHAVISDIGALLDDAGDVAGARARHEEALRLRTAEADAVGVAHATLGLARHLVLSGDPSRAREAYRHGLAVGRATEDDEFVAEALVGLGTVALAQSHLALARLHARAAIRQGLGMHDQGMLLDAFSLLVSLELAAGRPARAARLLGALDDLVTRSGISLYLRDDRAEQHEELRGLLGPVRVGHLLDEGRALRWRDAAGYALLEAGADVNA